MKKFNVLMLIISILFSIFIFFSLFYLFTSLRYGSLIIELLLSQKVWLALWVSVASSTIVVLISLLFGIPTSWMLANKDFKRKSIFETLIVDTPHSFPPSVVGTTYLLMFHPSNTFGALLSDLGINLVNSFWAMILVKTFVSAPFLISILTSKFREIRKNEIEIIAKSLGASDFKCFRTITLPLAKKALVAGSARCWARALGEVAGTIVFAGAVIPGVTQTMPAIIVFEAQESLPEALTLALILATFSVLVLVVFKLLMESDD